MARLRFFVVLAAVFFTLGCIGGGANESLNHTETLEPTLYFTQGKASCASGAEKNPTVVLSGESIVVSGAVQTRTPCFTLEGSLNVSGANIVISIETKPLENGLCIQCVGEIPFNAVVGPVNARANYNVTVNGVQTILENKLRR